MHAWLRVTGVPIQRTLVEPDISTARFGHAHTPATHHVRARAALGTPSTHSTRSARSAAPHLCSRQEPEVKRRREHPNRGLLQRLARLHRPERRDLDLHSVVAVHPRVRGHPRERRRADVDRAGAVHRGDVDVLHAEAAEVLGAEEREPVADEGVVDVAVRHGQRPPGADDRGLLRPHLKVVHLDVCTSVPTCWAA